MSDAPTCLKVIGALGALVILFVAYLMLRACWRRPRANRRLQMEPVRRLRR